MQLSLCRGWQGGWGRGGRALCLSALKWNSPPGWIPARRAGHRQVPGLGAFETALDVGGGDGLFRPVFEAQLVSSHVRLLKVSGEPEPRTRDFQRVRVYDLIL